MLVKLTPGRQTGCCTDKMVNKYQLVVLGLFTWVEDRQLKLTMVPSSTTRISAYFSLLYTYFLTWLSTQPTSCLVSGQKRQQPEPKGVRQLECTSYSVETQK